MSFIFTSKAWIEKETLFSKNNLDGAIGGKEKPHDLFKVISQAPGKEKKLGVMLHRELKCKADRKLAYFNSALLFLSPQIDFKHQDFVFLAFRKTLLF